MTNETYKFLLNNSNQKITKASKKYDRRINRNDKQKKRRKDNDEKIQSQFSFLSEPKYATNEKLSNARQIM